MAFFFFTLEAEGSEFMEKESCGDRNENDDEVKIFLT